MPLSTREREILGLLAGGVSGAQIAETLVLSPETVRTHIRNAMARWNQTDAAFLLGTDQPRVSDLRNGRLERFSLEQLLRFVSRVEGFVELRVEWGRRYTALFMPTRRR